MRSLVVDKIASVALASDIGRGQFGADTHDGRAAVHILDEVCSMARLEAQSAVMQSELKAVLEASRANTNTLRGNGHEGVVQRLSHTERTAKGNRQALASLQAALADLSGNRWRFWREVTVALIAASGPVLAILLTR